MPVHDWSQTRPGRFHHFHNSWVYRISDCLNAGLLPPGFYAAGEQVAGQVEPDVLALQQRDDEPTDWHQAEHVIAVAEQPPQVSQVLTADEAVYLAKQDRVAIRGTDGDRLVALVEIVSHGNKASRAEMERFLRKVGSAVDQKYHLLIIDLFPPGPFDQHGLHSEIQDFLYGTRPEVPDGKRLTLLALQCAETPTAWFEPIACGQSLPDMPLFLDEASYVKVPLEDTYAQAWQGLPEPWKQDLT